MAFRFFSNQDHSRHFRPLIARVCQDSRTRTQCNGTRTRTRTRRGASESTIEYEYRDAEYEYEYEMVWAHKPDEHDGAPERVIRLVVR